MSVERLLDAGESPMKKNVGGYDRIARFVVGALLVAGGAASFAGLFTLASGTLGVVITALLVLVGAVLLATAATRTCPVNATLGIDTARGASTPESEPVERGSRPG
jgi:hypothetical protein